MKQELSGFQQVRQQLISEALAEVSRILNPPPKRNAGQWADENRKLPRDSPEPGPWRTDRVPFWRDIYAAFSDTAHDTIVVACGAQMSKTEGVFNVIGHRMTDGPFVPAIYVGPTEKQVRSISKDRIDKMLRSTPCLWSRTEKGQRYGTFEKWIAGIRLGFAWAGSATELSSHPAGLILVDERDRMASDAGGEGDPFSLARARSKNYGNRKIGVFSTPTLWGASPIWSLLDTGTLQFWAFPCLHCFEHFVPHLGLLTWPDGCTADQALTAARLVCPSCGAEHESKSKSKQNAAGRYIRHRLLDEKEDSTGALFDQYVVDDDPQPKRTASFWISGIASPWASFGEIAKVLIEAGQSNEPEKLQAEVNTWGGEPFRMSGDAPEWQDVADCKTDHLPGFVPASVQKITMGVDVQKRGLFYVIRGWSWNMESWLLEYDYIAGETVFEPVWQTLRDVIGAPIGGRRIDRTFVDSGYRPGDIYRRPDHAVYTFTRQMPGQAFATKGRDTMETPYRMRSIDYSFGGTVVKGGVKLFSVHTDFFKRWIHARVAWPNDEPGAWHIHAATDDGYCKQIVAEELLMSPDGQAKWIVKSRNNHYLDCEVNAVAAAFSINVHKLTKPADTKPAKTITPARETPTDSRYGRQGL